MCEGVWSCDLWGWECVRVCGTVTCGGGSEYACKGLLHTCRGAVSC